MNSEEKKFINQYIIHDFTAADPGFPKIGNQFENGTLTYQSRFSQTHKVGNIGIIANFVFLEIRSFLLSLDFIMLVKVKLDITGSKRITFDYYKLYCSSSFLTAEVKQRW